MPQDVANRWPRALAAGGRDALATKGADGAKCRLSPAQLAELDAGPAAWGGLRQKLWPHQRGHGWPPASAFDWYTGYGAVARPAGELLNILLCASPSGEIGVTFPRRDESVAFLKV